MHTFQSFVFLGVSLIGTDIAEAVHRQMASGDHANENLTRYVASRFYESIRHVGLNGAKAWGPGLVVCGRNSVYFVRASQWRGPAVPAITDTQVVAVLERTQSASVIRLGPRRRRAIVGHFGVTGDIFKDKMLDRGLKYLLECY